MARALGAALLFVCAAAAASEFGVAAAESPDSSSEEADVDDDGEGDFAPFMIVVEHTDGWRCSGSLVSLRTALTSAWCARGRGPLPARELWALAAAAAAPPPSSPAAVAARLHGARRVARVAVATGADAEVGDGPDTAPESWRGGALDLAVAELEEPFGSAARARPILMATAGAECAGGAACHVSRALPPPAPRRARLRIVSADVVPPERCARAAVYWTAVRDRALCLVGPELCSSDWGGGVVCGGKLCGVLSRSVRSAPAPGAGGAAASEECGDTHAAQSVSLWRRFLHCAHTLRACGRGGDCADLCVERRLVEEPEPPASEPPAPPPQPTRPRKPTVTTITTTPSVFYYPTHTEMLRASPRARPSPTRAPPTRSAAPAAAHASSPSRSTRAYLKAGEYGDNAADYGGEEPAAPPAERRAAGRQPDAPAARGPSLLVEHTDGWRCSGSLVSLRTALTSAWCARGRGPLPARELWALAAAAAAPPPSSPAAVAARLHGARRVARVAVATGADAEVGDGPDTAPESWRGGALDLAVAELEEPFGSAARARPILMATAGAECAGGAACHVSRALPPPAPRRARLRIVSADVVPPERCARAAVYWTAVRDRALCLVGPELCSSDWGGGVVCGGKLCGVLSRSVRSAPAPGAGGAAASEECGDTHAAQSVSLWRRFLHCAHTLRACGRGGDCADLCVERRLVEEPEPPASEPPAPPPQPTRPRKPTVTTITTTPSVFYYPTHTEMLRASPRARPSPTRAPPTRSAAPA
ncbi:uncharacterized protein LOC114354225, partial [Ostrinia furnacalis]|uniref:uncharacterized protein LOC114354225 n=1 Tax=Ostrinia furnacalis TaxID=93504 RepID=UPI00104087CA